jgi:hypothetical protein
VQLIEENIMSVAIWDLLLPSMAHAAKRGRQDSRRANGEVLDCFTSDLAKNCEVAAAMTWACEKHERWVRRSEVWVRRYVQATS